MAKPTNTPQKKTASLTTLASALVNRMNLASRLGQQYNGSRDLYTALGYPKDLQFIDYAGKYVRLDIAKAIIDRPVGATWRGVLEMEETGISEITQFETDWQKLRDGFNLKSVFARADKLSQIGKYAVILLGFSDNTTPESFATPASKTAKLVYIKPYSEDSAKIATYEENPKDPRYGLPKLYSIQSQTTSTSSSVSMQVHYSRILHIVSDPLESEIEGTPKLEAVFNRLMDLEKIVGGDGEMFWRGARPGYTGNVNKEYTATSQTDEEIKDQIDEFENNLRRILLMEGVDLKELAQQIADPSQHVNVQLQMIAAVTGIPKRILTGSERGELSSAQDSQEWRAFIQERREEHAEIQIVRPFVDKMVQMGILPKPSTGAYKVRWPNIFDLNPKEKSEVGKNRASALRDVTTNPLAMTILSNDAILKHIASLEDDDIELIKRDLDAAMQEEALKNQLFPIEKTSVEPAQPAQKPKMIRTRK